MRKRHFGRLLSSALSVALAFTSVIPSYAMEGVDADDLAQAQEDAEAEEEETEEPAEEPVEEVPEELAATPAEEEEEDVLVEEDEDDVLVGESGDAATIHIAFTGIGDTTYISNNENQKDPDGTEPENLTIKEGSAASFTLPVPEKTGYTFDEWSVTSPETGVSVDEDNGNKINLTAEVMNSTLVNITLAATFTPNTYKVTFDAGTGVTVDPAEIDVTYDSAYSTNAFPTPSKPGYDFEGWFDENDADHETEITKDSTYAIEGNQKLVAYYTAWPYTIAFDKNDDAATGTMDPISATVGTDKTLTANAFTNAGKTFAGWATSSSGDVKYTDQATNVQEIPETKNGTVTLYAKWTSSTPETVAITVINVIDGVAEETGTDVPVTKGSDIATALTAAGKNEVTGKTFGGYFTDRDCAEGHALGEVNASTATTVYAKFTTETTPAEDFEVTFWDGDKELTGLKQTVKSGEKATKPATDPTKTNYVFKGWFTTDALSTEFDFNTAITATTKIYAKFEGKPIKITLNKNCEGDVTGLPAEDENHFVGITVKYGEQYTGLESLTRVGYDFVGWFTAKEHGSEITADSVVKFTTDSTLYARWKEKVVVVSFDGNNDNAKLSFVETEVPYGSKVQSVLPKITKTPEGYKFDGWYATKNGTELSDKVDDKTVVVDGKTYYVKWTPITYTIKFDVNGGTGKIDDQERTFDDKVELPATTGISKEHYSFAGWNTVKAPTAKNPGVSYDDLSIDNVAAVDKATVTLYAQWAGLTYDLTYDYGYSVGSEPVTSKDVVTYGEVYPAPKADKLAGNPGHYLKGWKNGETDVDITKPFKGSENVTLTAVWGDVTYKATFNSNNSKKLTKTITLNAEHTDAIPFVREDLFKDADAAGLTFEGWATADAFYAKDNNDLTEKDLIDVLKGDKTSTTQEVTTVVYAQWASTGKYNIQLNANLPTSAKPEDLRSGVDGRVESVNFAEPFFLTGSEFRLDGYALVGWTYKNAKGKTVTVKPAAKLVSLTTEKDKTVEVNAKWKATSYTLKYYLNGGTANKGTKTTVKFKVDENTRKGVPFLNYNESFEIDDEAKWVVKRRGYTFAGWGYTPGYYGKDRYWNMAAVANWNPNTYTLHLDADGGTIEDSGSTRDITTNFENSNNLSRYAPTKAGYTFTGWTGKGVNGKAKKFAPTDNALLKLLAFDEGGTTVTLKATYKANTNKITYDLDGGTINKKAPKSYVTDSEKNSAIPDPVKAGYKFDGWVVYDGEYDNVTSTAFDATTKKIKAGVSGELEFDAQWSTATYGFEFKSADGEKTYTVSDYTGIEYTEPVDFTAAAKAIEASEGFTGSVKGFALAKNSKKVKYALNKTYSKLGAKSKDETITLYVVGQAAVHRIAYDLDGGTLKNALYEYKTPTKADLKLKTTATKKGFTFKGFICRDEDEDYVAINDKGFVTAIKKDAAKDLEFTAVYDNEVSYSIVAMPNASDVTDDYGKVNAKKGVQFEMDGDKLFPISNDIDVIRLSSYLNWNRSGYRLAGFATSKSGKKAIQTLGGLSYNKKKVATVYAIWVPQEHIIRYTDYAVILRDGAEHTTKDEDALGISLEGFVVSKYGKAVTTKKVKAVKGYTFKGWKLDENNSDIEGLKVTYTDKTKKYVKTIAKNSTSYNVTLVPVFEENYYNLYVNPNGGTYNGSKKKQLVGKLYYSDLVPTYDILSKLSRSGYDVDCVSTTKNYKGYVSPYRSGLTVKNKGSVTVNAIWFKTSVVKPSVSAAIEGATMNIDLGYSYKANSGIYYEIQYSPSSSFTYNIQTITLEADAWEIGDNGELGELKPISRTVVEGKDYYLRARMCRVDSTGNFASSGWSATARASRAGVATDAYTVKNVIDNKAVAAGTVNVPKDGSMKIKDVLDAAKKNEKEGYDFGGYFTDDKCTTALEATATTLEAKVVYVKFTKKAAATVTGITVKTAPTKTTYTAGENFDPAGLVITATMSEGDPVDVTYNDTTKDKFTFAPGLTTALATTNNKVTITYGGQSVDQTITVNAAAATVTGIEVKTEPTKVTYTAGEFFDPTGLVITATMSEGDPEDVTYNATTKDDFTFNPALNVALATTNNKVTITYGGQSVDQTITVNAAAPTTVNITVINVKDTVAESTGADVSVEVDDDIATALNEANKNKLTGFTFGGYFTNADCAAGHELGTVDASAEMTVYAKFTTRALASIAVKADSVTNTTYNAGQDFDPTGLVIIETYDNGETEEVAYGTENAAQFTFAPSTNLEAGTTTVVVTYKGETANITITVEE